MNELVVAIAIILFPGLIATVIYDTLTVHQPRWGNFKYGIYSYIFGVVCYLLVGLLFRFIGYLWPPEDWTLSIWKFIVTHDLSDVSFAEVILATFFHFR